MYKKKCVALKLQIISSNFARVSRPQRLAQTHFLIFSIYIIYHKFNFHDIFCMRFHSWISTSCSILLLPVFIVYLLASSSSSTNINDSMIHRISIIKYKAINWIHWCQLGSGLSLSLAKIVAWHHFHLLKSYYSPIDLFILDIVSFKISDFGLCNACVRLESNL